MFSKACEYGIRAMMFIAQKSKENQRVGLQEIARGIDSPTHFMAKILQQLSRSGLVLSMKGPHGGFYMEAVHLRRTLADIVVVIDGDQLFKGCGLGLPVCNAKKPCPIHDEFKIVREKLKSMLETTRIGELTENLEKGLTYLRRT